MEQNARIMPGAERDEDTGKYQETYPTDDFLDAIEEDNGMASTQDVADYVGCSYETAYKKLRSLEDEESVISRKVANARVWMLAKEED